MPRYHFQLGDPDTDVDVLVLTLSDEHEAAVRARLLASELVHEAQFAREPHAWELCVIDDNGRMVTSIPLSDMMPASDTQH